MSMLQLLLDPGAWLAFFAYKEESGHLSPWEQRDLKKFIEGREYVPVAEAILAGQPVLPPRMTVLNKKHSGKKRTVYTYDRGENYCLKLLAWGLNGYDRVFAPNLYSFRPGTGVRKALECLLHQKDPGGKYSYKVDIQDYFNSVDVELLLPLLKKTLQDDPRLYDFLAGLLLDDRVRKEGQVVSVRKGIMAGVPVSGFLANLFLSPMDWWFYDRGIPYARYSDDIIVFGDTEAQLEGYIQVLEETLGAHGLVVNPKKVERTGPGEGWTYLGFRYHGGQVDLSPVAVEKVKGKLKRKARALYRWKTRKHMEDGQAIRAYIRHFNRKFFENPIQHEITWCRWYFPVLTTERSLRELDHYMQDCIRYIATGRHTKKNYDLRYETMQQWGYRPLVGEFYRQASGNR